MVSGLHVPLTCLIDYRGYRLVAMSLLPIHKLVYGSNNCGTSYHCDDPHFASLMCAAAEKINIAEHWVGDKAARLCGPADLEGHVGKDGLLYLLDFARVFPPEAPLDDGSFVQRYTLFKLLRPELVKQNLVPLSSDAFSGFRYQGDASDEAAVSEATSRLHKKVIPEFAQWLKSQCQTKAWSALQGRFSELLHREGINIRHLGRVRKFVLKEDPTALRGLLTLSASSTSSTDTDTVSLESSGDFSSSGLLERSTSSVSSVASSSSSSSDVSASSGVSSSSSPSSSRSSARGQAVLATDLLLEMVARVVKCELRQRLRQLSHVPRTIISEKPYKLQVIDFFNLVLGKHPCSDKYWKVDVKAQLLGKFPCALTQEELQEDCSLKPQIDIPRLFQAVQKCTGVQLTEKALQLLQLHPNTFELVYPDIAKMSTRTKDMNLVAQAEATALYVQSTKSQGEESDRIFQMAMIKFEAALQGMPDNSTTLKSWGDALLAHGMKKQGAERVRMLSECLEKYIGSRDTSALQGLSQSLFREALTSTGMQRDQLFTLTLDCLEAWQKLSMTVPVPQRCQVLRSWGDFFWEWAQLCFGAERESRTHAAGERYLSMLQLEADTGSSSLLHEYLPTLRMLMLPEIACIVQISKWCPQFTTFDSTYCGGNVTDKLVRVLAQINKGLKNVKLASCHTISINAFNTAFPALTSLTLLRCKMVGDEIVQKIAEHCPLLETLILQGCPRVSLNNTISWETAGASPMLPKLKHLDLRDCRNVLPAGLVSVVHHAPLLTELLLENCGSITSEVLQLIVSMRPDLSELCLNNCRLVTDAAVADAARRCARIHMLQLRGCTRLTALSITAVAASLSADSISQLCLAR
eukprot:TRINITY_DN8340_c0_g1_i1.p1 TRINITY_DN8340_c0_g1~~TRINITY_DN8340_c0_g1_i1.p1  ORF type:complete len:943 (+),score=171.83 TRINITY_DN8340_c0_g1_i1:238-2829(+)